MEVDKYGSQERARQKAVSRCVDESEIAKGRAKRDDVRMRNAFIPAHVAREAKIIDWGYK